VLKKRIEDVINQNRILQERFLVLIQENEKLDQLNEQKIEDLQ